jgi:hypothetical protein
MSQPFVPYPSQNIERVFDVSKEEEELEDDEGNEVSTSQETWKGREPYLMKRLEKQSRSVGISKKA